MSGDRGGGFKAAVVLIIAAVIIAFGVNRAAGKKAQTISDLDIYVKDEVGIISEDTKKIVLEENKKLEKEYGGAQLVVAVIETTGKENIRLYAKQYFKEKEVGSQTNKNGLLLLIATEDRDYYTMFGTGLADSYAGEVAVAVYHYLEPEFVNGNIDKAVATAAPELAKTLRTACEKWYTGTPAVTDVPVATQTPATPVPTSYPEPTTELLPTFDPDFLEEISGKYSPVSLVRDGVRAVIVLAFRLIFGILSSISVGFIVVVIIIISIINSGNKRSRKSGGVYFRDIPPSEPFESSGRGPVYRSSDYNRGTHPNSYTRHSSGGQQTHRSSGGQYSNRPGQGPGGGPDGYGPGRR